MVKSLWIRVSIFVSLGLFLVFISYKIYETYEDQALVQENNPSIKMPVIRRVRRVGDLGSPHLIYVNHQGKAYRLSTSSKYFRIAGRLDSMEVKYDAARDIAVLADQNVRGVYPLLLLLFLCGLFVVGRGVYDFWVGYRTTR